MSSKCVINLVVALYCTVSLPLIYCNCFLTPSKLSSVSVPRKDVREISETSPKPDALLKQGKNNFL